MGDSDWTAGPDAKGDGALALVEGGRLAAAGGLARRLAHDLANPLVGVVGVTELLLADAAPGTPAHGQLCLVRESAEEMRAVLARFRHFVSAPHDGVVRLDAIAGEAAAVVRAAGAAEGVDVLERRDDTGVVAAPAGDVLLSAFALIANAARATGRGGTVGVTTTRDDGVAVLTVADDGPGLDPEVAQRAFEPFFSTWGRPGLGLPAARAAARRAGGDVVLLQEAPGAAFRLTVPCVEGA